MSLFIYLLVHRYNTRENNITKGNSMPLTGEKVQWLHQCKLHYQYQTNKNY